MDNEIYNFSFLKNILILLKRFNKIKNRFYNYLNWCFAQNNVRYYFIMIRFFEYTHFNLKSNLHDIINKYSRKLLSYTQHSFLLTLFTHIIKPSINSIRVYIVNKSHWLSKFHNFRSFLLGIFYKFYLWLKRNLRRIFCIYQTFHRPHNFQELTTHKFYSVIIIRYSFC